ncbi:MAG: Hpt domain-containing protein [Candidatus Ornithospirochaeta sp.]
MTIEECYSIMGGDWDGIKRRLGNENLIARLSLKFLSAKEYLEIGKAISERDWDKAFLNAHTLKGVALNLGYNDLAKATSALTELLRPRKLENPREADRLYLSVTSEYNKVVNAINAYKDSTI